MDASPLLARIAQLLERHGLEAVLIGNAAAALQGAPVTTVDVDFLFRKTPANLKRLKAIASELDAVILRPYYPVSGLFRIARDADGLQLDFMTVIDGIPSFEGLRKRATPVRFEDARLYVASLPDTVCATTAGPIPSRERQRAVALPKPRATRKAKLEALKKESELALRDQIRRLLALPPERRTHFLRKRIGLRMSCI
jgi:hypothetical protein